MVSLTEKERKILQRLSESHAVHDVKRAFEASEEDLQELCRKLGAHSPKNAARIAFCAGIIS